MSHSNVITKSIHDNQILIVQLNSLKTKNAICRETAHKLYEIFQEFDQSDSYRVAILTGSNGTFCSGANLNFVKNDNANKNINENDKSQERNDLNENPDDLAPLGVTRMFLKKPVIAAIEGYCVAGGLELACWCDLRVGAKDSVFGVFCRRFSVPLIDLGTIRLPKLIGYSRAMDMILTGRSVSGEEAYSFGLLNRLVEKGNTLTEAIELAKLLCSHPQTCMRNDRISMYQSTFENMNMKDSIKNEMKLGLESLNSKEFTLAINRFIKGEGRHGDFNLSKL